VASTGEAALGPVTAVVLVTTDGPLSFAQPSLTLDGEPSRPRAGTSRVPELLCRPVVAALPVGTTDYCERDGDLSTFGLTVGRVALSSCLPDKA
jgi:hypothetical protein